MDPGWGRELQNNTKALAQFEVSGLTLDDYYTCIVMLTENSQIVARDLDEFGIDVPHSPLCLTLDGVQYLKNLQHPKREWLKQNWFAIAVAITTSAVSLTAAGLSVAIRIFW